MPDELVEALVILAGSVSFLVISAGIWICMCILEKFKNWASNI